MENKRSKAVGQKKESNFVVQGSILAIASIVVRIIGIAYRIPMINIIGDEGMGYYGTAFNVYNIALLLSSYSLPLAVSKMVSARLANGQYRNAERIFWAAIGYATVVGAVASTFASVGLLINIFVENATKVGVSNYFIKNTDSKPSFADAFSSP